MSRKTDRGRGLYNKFFAIKRCDGRDAEGEKHEHCHYFVLDLDCDKHAIAALHAYRISCEEEFPNLAEDLRRAAITLQGKFPRGGD